MLQGSAAIRIAFITTVFNGESTLARAIDSVLAQASGFDEYVIADDGSSDGSFDVIEKYASNDQRIKPLRLGRVGRAEALNAAISTTSCDFIFIQDADDLSEPHRVSATLPVFASHPDIGVVAGSYCAVDLDFGLHTVRKPPLKHADFLKAMCGKVPICHTASAYRRSVWKDVGGYSSGTPEIVDMPFWLAVAQTRWRFCGTQAVVATHHYSGTSNFTKLFRERKRAWVLYKYNLQAFRSCRASAADLAAGTGRLLTAWMFPRELRRRLRRRVLSAF